MFDSLKKMFEKNAKTISLKAVEDGRTIPMDQESELFHPMEQSFLRSMERSPR